MIVFYMFVIGFSFIISPTLGVSNSDVAVEKHIVIITASYNNKQWYKRNLDAVRMQRYQNYTVIYTDDASSDGTPELVSEYIAQHNCANTIKLIKNDRRLGAMANQYNAIHSCNDSDIIIIYDGDDWFAHENVLSNINKIYSDSSIWLTYGQFIEHPSGSVGFCVPMPAHVVRNNAFRDFAHIPSHLRTFYAGLFKKINKEDLMYNGDFLRIDADIAAMFPMIEMARDHFKFIPEVLLVYNGANQINDHKVDKPLQRRIDLELRKRSRYQKIESPF